MALTPLRMNDCQIVESSHVIGIYLKGSLERVFSRPHFADSRIEGAQMEAGNVMERFEPNRVQMASLGEVEFAFAFIDLGEVELGLGEIRFQGRGALVLGLGLIKSFQRAVGVAKSEGA